MISLSISFHAGKRNASWVLGDQSGLHSIIVIAQRQLQGFNSSFVLEKCPSKGLGPNYRGLYPYMVVKGGIVVETGRLPRVGRKSEAMSDQLGSAVRLLWFLRA
jgi:hypothetical protein